jgi:hypothetical protein
LSTTGCWGTPEVESEPEIKPTVGTVMLEGLEVAFTNALDERLIDRFRAIWKAAYS